MQPFQCNLQPEIQEPHRTTHTDTTTRCKTHRRNQFAHETTPAAPVAQTRYLSSPAAATLHGKTQGLVLRLPPQLTTSLPHRFPSSPLPIVTTSLRPLPFLINALPHHFPSSPPPFLTIPLHHHFPSSPLPFVTTSLRHHPVIVTTLHQGQFHRFLFLCYVLLCYALLCDLPPFIKVNSTASLSFIKVNSTASSSCVMYCYVMYCYVIYHPSSRSIPPLLILVLCIVMLCIVM